MTSYTCNVTPVPLMGVVAPIVCALPSGQKSMVWTVVENATSLSSVWIGPSLFGQHPVVYVALAMVAVLSWAYRRTNLGMTLRAAGEKPAALDVAGGHVIALRSAAVLFTGAMAGLGGAFMGNVGAGIFIPYMTGGAGFIGIVLAMLARGRPLWVLIGALIFGAALSLTTALQVAGSNIPTDVIQMLPFAAVMLVLVIWGRKARLPAALGQSYQRGAR